MTITVDKVFDQQFGKERYLVRNGDTMILLTQDTSAHSLGSVRDAVATGLCQENGPLMKVVEQLRVLMQDDDLNDLAEDIATDNVPIGRNPTDAEEEEAREQLFTFKHRLITRALELIIEERKK